MTATAIALLLLKVSLVLAAAFLARRMLSGGSAVRRHGMWSWTFASLLALPLLIVLVPAIEVPVPAWQEAETTSSDLRGEADIVGSSNRSNTTDTTNTTGTSTAPADLRLTEATVGQIAGELVTRPSLLTVLLSAWIAGAVAAMLALIVSFIRVARLAASGRELDDAEWIDARARVAAKLGYGHDVRMLACSDIRTPMAGGLLRSTVFVPADATRWDARRREIVLAHEIAHLANRDPLRNLVSRVACTVYWFHPLAWMALRESAADCEQACDETVLSLGVRPSTYADLLLDFAAGPVLNPKVAVPMVRRARLEERLMSILEKGSERPVARRTIVPAFVAIALTLSLAAAQPVTMRPALPQLPVANLDSSREKVQESAKEVLPLPAVSPENKPSTATTAPVTLVQDRSCWDYMSRSGSFNGSSWTNGRGAYVERVGHFGGDPVFARIYEEDTRVCARTDGYDGDWDDRPSQWPGNADRLWLETTRGNETRRLVLDDGRVTYFVNGASRPFDAAAQEWRTRTLALMDVTWEATQLRGQVSTMRGEISTAYGERSTLLGEISTLRGHVSTLRGEISTLRGHMSTMQGEISTIRGHESTLRGQISTERGAISTLQSSRWDTRVDVEREIDRHRDNIRRIEDEIARYDTEGRVRAVQRRIDAFDVERQVEAVERQIREFDVESKIAAVQRRLDRTDVSGRVSGIERDIGSLNAERRIPELVSRETDLLARLRAVLR